MKKKNKHNSFGYKICYREPGKIRYRRYFKTYTYREAKMAYLSFKRFPPKSREDGHMLSPAEWVIIPIKHSEVKDGIWLEDPF